jgi:hypothetical protein
MEQRDYLETMIEQMGLFLRRMLSSISKDTGTEKEMETIAEIDAGFINEFNISIDELITLSENNFKKTILNLKLKEVHFESFSELLLKMSFLNFPNEKVENLKDKAVLLLDLTDSTSNSYSIDRINKKNEILNSKL